MSEPERSEESWLRLLMQQTRDHAVLLLTPEGRIRSWLAAAPRTFGYRAEEIIGQSVDCLFTPEDRALGMPELEREVALREGRSEDERWHVRRDGVTIWCSGTTTRLCDAEGQMLGFAKVVRDRTDQRARIEALENRLKVLASQHAEQQVFLAGMAHEIRNLLTPLFNASYLLRLNPAAATLGQPLATIERQLPALRRMADDLGEAGRRGNRRPMLNLEELNLNEVLEGVAASMQPEFVAHELALHLLLPTQPLRVRMDGARIQQVLHNLLGNAARYTPSGGQVSLKASVEGSEAVVRVKDTGMGIAPEMLPRIFEFFTRAPSSEEIAPEGMGLGLALVKEIALLHSGTVEVRSEGLGQGSEFSLRLPLQGPAVIAEAASG